METSYTLWGMHPLHLRCGHAAYYEMQEKSSCSSQGHGQWCNWSLADTFLCATRDLRLLLPQVVVVDSPGHTPASVRGVWHPRADPNSMSTARLQRRENVRWFHVLVFSPICKQGSATQRLTLALGKSGNQRLTCRVQDKLSSAGLGKTQPHSGSRQGTP
eukprot:6455050-Amphidinium_carterae.1